MEYVRDRRRRNELCGVMGFPGNPEMGRRQIATLYFAVMAIRHVYQVACGPRIISSAFWAPPGVGFFFVTLLFEGRSSLRGLGNGLIAVGPQ